ncbi:hypothetical protein C8D89_103261 [Actinomycetospora cinnamomea]|uniref:Uncharacterized protein n=2 Tax=Actinomycetospora cinnamomea TaxID=663609 RepID=A0A2U1FIF0_9PSEU|nr:hypothetical protein C8D89_103261 [Actinomycetospora cinnamomea]
MPCPKAGRILALALARPAVLPAMDPELVRHVAATTGLPGEVAARVVADVVAFYSETTEEFVRRRHRELQARDRRNAEIWTVIADELAHRPVAPGPVSERRLRRIVYG